MPDASTSEGTVGELTALRARVAALEAERDRLRDERRELREAEAELRAIFQAMTDVVLVVDAGGRYVRIAPTAPELLYRPSNDLLGKTMHEVLPAEQAEFFLRHVRQALAEGRVVSMDYSLTLGERVVHFAANITPMAEDLAVLVARDITARRQVEELLLREKRHQEELLRLQEATLAEMSTPLIPVSDEILVMPLIGALEQRRVDRVLTVLLEGIHQGRARVAILDITGISVVDSHTADALIRAARAVQLLGAQVILTGIRPDVAQTLVAIDAALGGIVTCSTLQAGIARAGGLRPAGAAARR